MTSYTELLRENQLGDVDCSGDNKIWRIVNPRLLYRNGKKQGTRRPKSAVQYKLCVCV